MRNSWASWLLIIAFALLVLAWWFWQAGQQEIRYAGYQQVETMVKEYPSLKPLVNRCMQDGVIDRVEYREIQQSYQRKIAHYESAQRKQAEQAVKNEL